ncbi:MAG: hypothetical protein ABIW76_19700 [Fibrobacteria bacterium]
MRTTFVLCLIICFAQNALGQYLVQKRNDFWGASIRSDTLCFNEKENSIVIGFRDQKLNLAVDSINHLSYRNNKSWWPYLLTAGAIGVSSYTYFHFASRDDAWFTGEGKARFAGFFWGGIALGISVPIKEILETTLIVNQMWGLRQTHLLEKCEL